MYEPGRFSMNINTFELTSISTYLTYSESVKGQMQHSIKSARRHRSNFRQSASRASARRTSGTHQFYWRSAIYGPTMGIYFRPTDVDTLVKDISPAWVFTHFGIHPFGYSFYVKRVVHPRFFTQCCGRGYHFPTTLFGSHTTG